jgi:hypothetical protein
MTLHIVNPSRQNHIFLYREPVNNLQQQLMLHPGGDAVIGANWTPEQQAKVIVQLQRFGARPSADTNQTMRRFNGLLYNDVRQVMQDEAVAAFDGQMQAREDRTAAETTKAALGYDRAARQSTPGRARAKVTETTIDQAVLRGRHPKGDEVHFNLSVDPESGRSDVRLPIN